jgi:hypothetical protein
MNILAMVSATSEPAAERLFSIDVLGRALLQGGIQAEGGGGCIEYLVTLNCPWAAPQKRQYVMIKFK